MAILFLSEVGGEKVTLQVRPVQLLGATSVSTTKRQVY